MRRIINLIICLLFMMVVLCGCGSKKEYYVNLDELETESKGHITEYASSYDECTYYDFMHQYSYNGCSLYASVEQQIIDIENGSYKILCGKAGCNHMDENCETYMNRQNIRCYGNGVYFIFENKIYYRNSYSQITMVYRNSYSTEYSGKYYPVTDEEPWNPEILTGFLFISDHEMLVIGANYFFVYDIDEDRAGEPVEVCDSTILNICVNGNEVYSNNINGELYVTHLDQGTSERILQQGYHVKVINDRLWYVVWAGGTPQILSNSFDLTDEVVEVEYGDAFFVPCDEGIMYMNDNKVIMHTFGGEEKELIDINTLTYSGGDDGCKYELSGSNYPVYIDGKIYISVHWEGYDNDSVFVWYYLEDGEIKELSEE